jgi:pyruvate dehydrogenase E2 component (dihydrolipoamide acetyltransferase)
MSPATTTGEFRMPALGADMDEGTIAEWRVSPGDTVRRGDIIAVVDTDKSTIEVEVFADGVVTELVVPAGETVPVGTVLATLGPPEPTGTAADTAPAAPRADVAVPVTPVPVAPAPVAPAPAPAPAPAAPRVHSPLIRQLADHRHIDLATVTGTGPGGTVTRADVERAGTVVPATPAHRRETSGRVRATPLARRLAARRGVDLGVVTGRGPGGAITAADVPTRAPAAPAAPTTTDRRADRARTRRAALVDLMSRSARDIPQYHLMAQVELGRAMDWLAATNESRPLSRRLLPAALVMTAIARAAAQVPAVNGHWVNGGFHPATGVDLGVAVRLRDGGLLVPCLAGADRLDLDTLMERLRDVVSRARAGALRSGDAGEPTITVTNLGADPAARLGSGTGADAVFGIIHPPQVALVGVGAIATRPWVLDDTVVARPVATITVTADHRVSDGHDAARFLALIDHALQRPEEL